MPGSLAIGRWHCTARSLSGQPQWHGLVQPARGIGTLDGRAADRQPVAQGGRAMLFGERITLRPVREADLEAMYAAYTDLRTRGPYFPLSVISEPAFRKRFADTGFWDTEDGVLLIVTGDGAMAGHIEFFKPVGYWDAWELSYRLYDERLAGHGYTTEAVRLLVDYLFGTKKPSRIQLVIVPENAASRRIAEKCGFTLEGTVRGAFFNDGRNQDVLLYGLLRDDPRPWRTRGG
jgi:[ribosomal protein S5]-alanine N-acetyltransferase